MRIKIYPNVWIERIHLSLCVGDKAKEGGLDHSKSAGAADDSEGRASLIMSCKERAKDD